MIKKYLIGGIVALTVALVASSANAAITRNLTVGSQGADVAELQAFLISRGYGIPAISTGVAAPGYFGSQTKSAVMAYQAANGIPNTGFFGPLTRASYNVLSTTGGTTGGAVCPAGYSCTPIATTPVCPVGFVCTPVSGGTPITGTNGLRGGVGDITVSERTSGTEDEVMEGEDDVRILGFEIEADDSDVAITSIRVEFEHTGSGSDRLDRYVEEVSIIYDNQVVATVDADEFSESSDVYSENIAIRDAIVRDGSTGRFYVAVTALNNVDSDDIGEEWLVGLGQIRFEDATGAILTDTTGDGVSGGDNNITATFTFEDLSSSGDVELNLAEDDEEVNESGRVVRVSDSGDTNDVDLLSFTLEAEGSDIFLDELVFNITSNSGTGVTQIANDFRLMMGNDEIGRVSIDRDCDGGSDGFGANADEAICVVISDIDDDDIRINEGDTESFMLVADINDTDDNFASGDTLSISLDSDDIVAENENGNQLGDSALSGIVSSSNTSFSASGIVIREGASEPAATIDNNGTADTASDDRGVFVINFDVTAFEDTAYIALTGASSTSATPSAAGVYAYVESTNANDTPLGTGDTTVVVERVSGGSIVNGNYVRVNAGQTVSLRATVYHNAAASNVSTRAQLYAVNFAETATAGTDQQLAVPTGNFQSSSIIIPN